VKTPSKIPPRPSLRATPNAAPVLTLAAPAESPRFRLICHAIAGAIAIGMIAGVCWMSEQDVVWPDDAFSDMNTLMSAENFATQGFFHLHFLPVHYVPDGGEQPNYYTHYPPLPNVFCGLVWAAGGQSLAAQRIICGLVGIVGWLLLYWAVARRLGGLAGVMGLAFAATSGFFFSYGVSVHQHGFNIFFVGLFLALFLTATDHDRPRWWLWAGCWAAMFLESLASFEFIVYMQAVAWLYVLGTGQFRRRWKVLLVLAAAPVAGVGLHFLQNAWATGWQAARGDFLGYGQYGETYWDKLKVLSTNFQGNVLRCFGWAWVLLPVGASAFLAATALGGLPERGAPAGGGTRRNWAIAAALAGTALAAYMAATFLLAEPGAKDPYSPLTLPGIAATAAYVLALVLAWPAAGPQRKAVAMVAALAVAAMAWYVGMASHAHHPHTVNQIMPLAFAGFGGLAGMVALRLFAKATTMPLRAVLVAGVLVLVCVGLGQKHALDRRLRPPASRELLPPAVIAEGLGPDLSAAINAGVNNSVVVARAIGPDAFGANSGVLFNSIPEAMLSYFLRSSAQLCPMRGLPFPESLPRLQKGVGNGGTYKYYLYFLDNQKWLFDLLRENCRGKELSLELGGGKVAPLGVYCFDISPLNLAPDQRPPLDKEMRERQTKGRGEFEPWIVPGFAERFMNMLIGRVP
jgi:hypothetical protein